MRARLASVAAISRELREATRCPTCGKPTLVLSANPLASRKAIPENVSPETHCACAGGPAAPIKGPTDADFLMNYGGFRFPVSPRRYK